MKEIQDIYTCDELNRVMYSKAAIVFAEYTYDVLDNMVSLRS